MWKSSCGFEFTVSIEGWEKLLTKSNNIQSDFSFYKLKTSKFKLRNIIKIKPIENFSTFNWMIKIQISGIEMNLNRFLIPTNSKFF